MSSVIEAAPMSETQLSAATRGHVYIDSGYVNSIDPDGPDIYDSMKAARPFLDPELGTTVIDRSFAIVPVIE